MVMTHKLFAAFKSLGYKNVIFLEIDVFVDA